ncbi:GAF domain-containing protein [bacterium]|nr:GAF domain-containing protein [bacterium]
MSEPKDHKTTTPPQEGKETRRRLVAMMFTDIAGYSSLASQDEKLAFTLLEEHRSIFRRIFPMYGGKENKTIGDAFFIEFGSVVEAVRCAIEIQTAFFERNSFSPPERQIHVRIGVHLSDIIDFEGDSYGDGVNIAARIEGLALLGGVCITQQVVDQIERKIEIPIKKIGRTKLKNISTATEIYRLVFPWEEKVSLWKRLRIPGIPEIAPIIRSWKINPLMAAQLGGTLAVFGVTLGLVLTKTDRSTAYLPTFEAKNQAEKAPRTDLSQGWQYVVTPETLNTKQVNDLPDSKWKRFDINSPWQSADEFNGEYWMKKTFIAKDRYLYPAMVLGLVNETHRTFLNGKFIGGANHPTHMEFYSIDSSLIRWEGENTILLHGTTKRTLMPGLFSLFKAGTFMGEFDEAYSVVFNDRVRYHMLRSIYLVVAFLTALMCLTYYFYHRDNRLYLYFSVYLFLGAIGLAYYNSFAAALLDYRYHRFMKLFAYCCSSITLCSIYLNLKKLSSLERSNNIFSIFAGLGIFGLTLVGTVEPSQFLRRYEEIFQYASFYTFFWIGAAVIYSGVTRYQKFTGDIRKTLLSMSLLYEVLTLVFGFTEWMLIRGSSKSTGVMSALGITSGPRSGTEDLAITLPFVFAVTVLIGGILDYVLKSRRFQYKKMRDDFLLTMTKEAADHKNLESTIFMIQDKMSKFIKAERSTIYLLDNKGCLKASYLNGDPQTKHEVKRSIQPNDGIIGYVFQSKSPLLIKDLATDMRFSQYLKDRSGYNGYKTRSCIIIPLLSGTEIVGILTFADKSDGTPFTRHDFTLTYVVSRHLAILINNKRLQEELSAFLAA